MVIARRSVHLIILFPGQAWTSSKPVISALTFACNWHQPFLNESAEGRRMTIEIISWSISTKVWDQAGIELATPGSAVRHASVDRHVTDCATRPGSIHIFNFIIKRVIKLMYTFLNKNLEAISFGVPISRVFIHTTWYSKTCVKRPLSKIPQIGFQDQLLLNVGQKYCRMLQGEHSAIL